MKERAAQRVLLLVLARHTILLRHWASKGAMEHAALPDGIGCREMDKAGVQRAGVCHVFDYVYARDSCSHHLLPAYSVQHQRRAR